MKTNRKAGNFYHLPVLVNEVLEFMGPESGKLIVDGTLGGGGHTEAMLKAGAQVVGLDQDKEALNYAKKRLSPYGESFVALHTNFRNIADIFQEIGIRKLDGILLDLGVSSHHLDEASRGFSFQKEGALDMRMDASAKISAAHIVNTASEFELATVFHEFGEERAARKIARGIVQRRVKKEFTSTTDLADFVASLLARGGKKHPATRVFQALRIAVNQELDALQGFLESTPALLSPGGRLLIITFHSLEDRIVKHFFKKTSQPQIDKKEWPSPRVNPDFHYKLITRRPMIPTQKEIQSNKRARSAKLRVVEKI